MRLDDLFVSKPVKEEQEVKDIIVDGSFDCQNCDFESDQAYLREGKIWWKCPECNYKSVAGGLG